ncbi:MAG: hypothetical protein J7621_02710 [Niastella sp.]|nr:hypothetical protein [Niastella sp.]
MIKRTPLRQALLLHACMLLSLSVHARQQRFITWNVSHGLSQSSVHAIYQDSDGLIWIGTQDGLNSFDGQHFKTWKHHLRDTTTISDQFILSITEDNTGHLWIGTRNGFNKFNKRTGRFIRYYATREEKRTIGQPYFTILRNPQGDILVPGRAGTLSVFKNGQEGTGLQTYPFMISEPAIDSSGRLWGFDKNNVLYCYDPALQYRPQKITSLPQTTQLKCVISPAQELWCYEEGAKNSIWRYHLASRKWQQHPLSMPAVITHIGFDHNSNPWISTYKGLYTISQQQLPQQIGIAKDEQFTLPPGKLLCSYHDRQGNLWVGSASGGLAFHNPSFNNYALLTTGIRNDGITAAVDYSEDERWIAAVSGLYIARRQPGEENNYAIEKRLLPGQVITALAKDKEGKIWVAVQKKGLYVISKSSTRSPVQVPQALLQDKDINYLFCDNHNRILVGTVRGLFVLEQATGKWESFTRINDNSATGYYIMNIFQDDQHRIWVSKNTGIDVYDQELRMLFTINSASDTSAINRTLITAITQDKRGDIWIATLSSGIYQYHNGQLSQFTTDHGLSSNVTYGIICDRKGRLWITTTSGINIYVPEEKKFYKPGFSEGVPAGDYMVGALTLNEHGQIYLGTTHGLLVANASNIELQNKTAEAAVSDVKVNGESIASLQQSYVLQPGYTTISFEFSIREAFQPGNIIYQYRLSHEKEWNTLPQGASRINYTQLPFGEVTMQVRAAYSTAELREAPVSTFNMNVRPPYWQTTWFKVLSFLAIGGLIGWGVRIYTQARYARQMQALQVQRQLQRERERISRDLHDNIGAYTSALIAGINRLKDENHEHTEVEELGEYAAGIMASLRQTIWVLNNESLTLTAFVDRFKSYAVKIMRNYPDITLQINQDSPAEKTLSPQQSLNLFRIMQEALHNACKYAAATCIEIIVLNRDKFSITIKDNGRGLSNHKKEDSYGLHNMEQRAEESGYHLLIQSGEGSGTAVHIEEK